MSVCGRPVLALALCAAVGASSGLAAAAPQVKPACHLVTDDSGDTGALTEQPGLDVISADIASDAKHITAVIRLAGPPGGGNPEAVNGAQYKFRFTPAGADHAQYLGAFVPFVGEPIYFTGETQGNRSRTDDTFVTGSIKGNVVTITAPVAAFRRVAIAPGTKLRHLAVETTAQTGLVIFVVDEAETRRTYLTGSRSCVKPGG